MPVPFVMADPPTRGGFDRAAIRDQKDQRTAGGQQQHHGRHGRHGRHHHDGSAPALLRLTPFRPGAREVKINRRAEHEARDADARLLSLEEAPRAKSGVEAGCVAAPVVIRGDYDEANGPPRRARRPTCLGESSVQWEIVALLYPVGVSDCV